MFFLFLNNEILFIFPKKFLPKTPPPKKTVLAGSDSELSLSGFETVASRSFEEEEEEGGVMFGSSSSSSSSRLDSMAQGDRHSNDQQMQPNGITKYRSAVHAGVPNEMLQSFITHTHTHTKST